MGTINQKIGEKSEKDATDPKNLINNYIKHLQNIDSNALNEPHARKLQELLELLQAEAKNENPDEIQTHIINSSQSGLKTIHLMLKSQRNLKGEAKINFWNNCIMPQLNSWVERIRINNEIEQKIQINPILRFLWNLSQHK